MWTLFLEYVSEEDDLYYRRQGNKKMLARYADNNQKYCSD